MSSTDVTATTRSVQLPVGQQQAEPKGRSLWKDAYYRLKKDRMAIFCIGIVIFYALVAMAAKFGLIATPWDRVVGAAYSSPSLGTQESWSWSDIVNVPKMFRALQIAIGSRELWCGTDMFGRSVFYKVIHGTRIAMSVGLISSLISMPVGLILGAVAGYFGGWIDDLVVWFYTTLSSIPDIMLLVAITFMLGKGLTAIYFALGATAWVPLARVIRGEFIKHKSRDYVVAADSLGATHASRIFKHILPNVSHFVIIRTSIQFVTAIKAEVILSFLGLGVQGQPSWGVMIDDAKLEVMRGVWWQLAFATIAMFFVVLAFNILGDSLRDALDPKIK